ncbi:MAG: PIN domain-containing protein [Beijerinckiaceae bacterium]
MTAFFDTDILIYAQEDEPRGQKARALMLSGGTISAQVLNEFCAVSRRKQRKEWREIGEAVEDIIVLCDKVLPLTAQTNALALALARAHGFRSTMR